MLAVGRIVDGVAGLEPEHPIPHHDLDQAGDHVDPLLTRVRGVGDVLDLAGLEVDEVGVEASARDAGGQVLTVNLHRFLGERLPLVAPHDRDLAELLLFQEIGGLLAEGLGDLDQRPDGGRSLPALDLRDVSRREAGDALQILQGEGPLLADEPYPIPEIFLGDHSRSFPATPRG